MCVCRMCATSARVRAAAYASAFCGSYLSEQVYAVRNVQQLSLSAVVLEAGDRVSVASALLGPSWLSVPLGSEAQQLLLRLYPNCLGCGDIPDICLHCATTELAQWRDLQKDPPDVWQRLYLVCGDSGGVDFAVHCGCRAALSGGVERAPSVCAVVCGTPRFVSAV